MLHRTTIAGLVKAIDGAKLSRTQMAVLGTIASGRGAMVSREAIYENVWGRRPRPEYAHNIVAIAVFRLRQKGYRIVTRYGGYAVEKAGD